MKRRPLCFLCLLFLLIQSILLIIDGGEPIKGPPAGYVLLEGQVYQKSQTSKTQILYLKNNSNYNFNFILYSKEPIPVAIGQRIRLKGEAAPFERARNPGNFDQALYYAKQKVGGVVWCEKVLEIQGKPNVFAEQLYRLKMGWMRALQKHMGEENGAILSAMLLGDKGAMDTGSKELYQKSGIGHLLAISGLHISFVGLGIYRLFRKGGFPFLIAGILSLGILTVYGCMIGFSVSVFRAYVMLFLRIGADITGRVYDMLTSLLLAASLSVAWEPLYLIDAGFLMSYGALLGIFFVLPALQKSVPVKGLSGIAINLTLFPILLWFYYEFPMYSLLINLLAIPLMSILLTSGFGGSAFLWCPPFRWICFFVCQCILGLYEWMGILGNRLPFSRVVFGRPSIWMVLAYYLLLTLIIFLVPVIKKRRILLWIPIGVFICCMGIRMPQGIQVTMLDVGQGDCIFVRGPGGKTYLVDGGSSDVSQVGQYRIEPFLKSQGVGTLDYVFLSHGDGDHCNGIEEMLNRQLWGVRIRHLVVGANYENDETLVRLVRLARKENIEVMVLERGKEIREKELFFSYVQPSRNENFEGNAGSMVLELRYKEFDMLFTGDVELEGEEALCKELEGKSYEVLKVSHHGSKGATSEEFLRAVCVRMALISAGVDNAYSHPHPATVSRLKDEGCTIFETAKSGAITLISDGNSLTIFLLPYRL